MTKRPLTIVLAGLAALQVVCAAFAVFPRLLGLPEDASVVSLCTFVMLLSPGVLLIVWFFAFSPRGYRLDKLHGIAAGALYALPFALLGPMMASYMRATVFWFSLNGLLVQLAVLAVCMTPVVPAIFVARGERRGEGGASPFVVGALTVLVMSFLLLLLVEWRCSLEEREFRAMVEASGGVEQQSRARRSPFDYCGLMYGDGEFSAHD